MASDEVLNQILDELRDLKLRIAILEQKNDIEYKKATQSTTPTPVQSPEPAVEVDDPWNIVGKDDIQEEIVNRVDGVPEQQPEKVGGSGSGSFELQIGKKIFSIIGALSIFLGMVFLIIYSLSLGLLGPIGKVFMGLVAGLICLFVGDILYNKDRRILSTALTGCGFGILFLVSYAMGHVYSLISIELSLILQFLLVVVGIYFSNRYDSYLIVAESVLFGYMIPYFQPITEFGLLWNIIISGALISICRSRQRLLLAVTGVILVYASQVRYYFSTNDSLWVNSIFCLAYLILFTYLSLVNAKSGIKLQVDFGSSVIQSLNTIAYYLFMYGILNKYYPDYLGLFTLVLGVAYMMLSAVMQRIGVKSLFLVNLIVALTLITITIPIQFDGRLITVAWIAQAVIIVLIGMSHNNMHLRSFGNCIAGLTLVKTLFFDSLLSSTADKMIIFGPRPVAFILTIIGYFILYRAYSRTMSKNGLEQWASPMYALSGLIIMGAFILTEYDGAWITLLWSALALGVILTSVHLTFKEGDEQATARFERLQTIHILHIFAYTLAAFISFKVTFVDPWLTEGIKFLELSDSRILAFTSAILAFYLIGKNEKILKNLGGLSSKIPYAFISMGSFFVFWLLWLETHGVWKSVTWSVLALLHLGIGFKFNDRSVRTLGLILFVITILKVFLYDVAGLHTIYRVISFMVLGVILIITSFAYNHFSQLIERNGK